SAIRVALSRSGRSLAYLQDGVNPGGLGGQPVNACAQATQATNACVSLRDVSTGRTRLLGQLTDASILGHVPVVRIDPSERVVAAALPVGLNEERVVLWDLATGDKHAEVEVPAQVLSVHDMWLAPDGQTAVLDAEVPRFHGSQLLRRELLWL